MYNITVHAAQGIKYHQQLICTAAESLWSIYSSWWVPGVTQSQPPKTIVDIVTATTVQPKPVNRMLVRH